MPTLNNNTLTFNQKTFDISKYGGIRWDGDKKLCFFVDLSGKPADGGTVEKASVSDYRAIEAVCVPYWRLHNQSVGE